jgi:hypothetical protein
MEQSKIFADYLNSRPETIVVLLGDMIHFANSIWNPSVGQMSKGELTKSLEKDVSIWEDFVARLKIPTFYYLGSHEFFALKFIEGLLPSRKFNLTTEFVFVPDNLQIIKLGSRNNPIFLTGLHILDNINNKKSQEFIQRKKQIEEWIKEKVKNLDIPEPDKTIFCTHDPCDFFYCNMGYRELTQMLEKWAFRVHYHAHIHSNIRQTVIGKTPSENRSFIALSKFNPQALEPSTNEIQSLYGRDV